MKTVFINRFRQIIICFLCIFISGCYAGSEQKEYDIVIVDGRVLDGSGNPWQYADIAIKDGKIEKVGDLTKYIARDTINAEGLYVSPGFIDVHSHAASGLVKKELGGAEPLLRQGITTVVVNPDGGGAVDLAQQRRNLLKHGIGVNVAQLVPHGSIRKEVMGMEDRPATPAELDSMKMLVRKGMKEGAFGLSSGPFYAPGSYSSTKELIELANVAAEFDGVYTSHIRDESDYTIGLEAAVDEVIKIAREAKLPGVVTHIKALGPPVWGMSEVIIDNIEKARSEGVELYADQYPYTASATSLIAALVPRWAEEGGHDSLASRLNNSDLLPKIRKAMKENLTRRGGAGRIQFRYFKPDSAIEGKSLEQVAREQNKSALDMAVKLIKKGNPRIVSFNMTDSDVHGFMQQPWTMTSSDGGLVKLGKGVPHPRNYGTFPRKIRKYVLEKEVVDLPFAIRSMTSLPAQVFGMKDRGQIREGAVADIAIFDLDRVADKATFQEPHQFSEGMVYVLVNGQYALKEGRVSDRRWGKVLNHSDQ